MAAPQRMQQKTYLRHLQQYQKVEEQINELFLLETLSVKITFATLSVLHGVVKHAIFAGVYR